MERNGTETDRDLEAFFQAVKAEPSEARPDLLARILDDAYAEQDARTARVIPDVAEIRRSASGKGLLAGLREAIGGWPALAGLATATLAGVWIGYSPPASLDALSTTLLDSDYSLTMDSSLPDYDFLLTDG
jgi:hypothetical protein